ncbi:hypothetical protein [Nostoc sp.]|uniref:hypothetical protein n=1 Tax=Nostoc sp. TaxID=1180 RepID=UPI002FF7E80A
MENPRQFASLDASDAALHGSLTNRPASAVAAGDPIDFEAISARVRYERTLPTYQYKESPAEIALRLERQAAAEQRIRAETAATNEKNRLLLERAQVQRSQLQSRISGSEVVEAEFAQTRRESPLAQIQRSTPERQPLPSTGSPPPTLSGTAARADSLVEPTATPRPAILREAIATGAGNAITALPRALPQAAGRLVVPGVGAVLSIGTRLVVGQSVTQAVTSTGAGLIGTGIGLVVGTAIGGPIGGVVGSMIGGTAASLFSDWLFAQNLPKGTAHLQTFTPNYPAFLGGQTLNAAYRVTCTYDMVLNGEVTGTFTDGPVLLYGPISGPRVVYNSQNDYGIAFDGTDGSGNPRTIKFYRGGPAGSRAENPRNIQIAYQYGGENGDNGGNMTQPVPPPDNSPYRYDSSPIGSANVVPSGVPGAGKNKPESRDIAPSMPSNNTPNGARGFVGHGGLAPSYLPNPEHQPSNLGGMLPAIKNAPQPLPFAEPEDIAIPRITPMLSSGEATTTATNPSTFAYPAYVPEIAQPIPISDALSPVPKAKSQPSPRTPTQAANDDIKKALDEQKKDFDDQIKRLTAIATGLAALTPAIQGIPDAIATNPNVRAANRDDVQGAVCEIAQPTGCLGAPIQRAEDAANANGTRLDQINAALGAGNAGANAALLAGQATILERLGDQLPGGIGGKLSRFAEWMHLDRVLNIMILATTIHNGLMLSNDIAQTLLGIINNALTLIGLKKEDGSGFDIGSIISGSIENLIKGAIGTENYQQLSTAWQKANRTYQATTNVLNNLMNVNSVITNALEVIGSYTGKIGNALRIWGVLGEKAYSWMNPQPSFDNQWITKLQQLQQNASTVAMVAQIPVDAVNAVTELNNSATELVKAVQQEPDTKSGIDVGEAAKVKAEREAAKAVSYVPAFDISDLFDADD